MKLLVISLEHVGNKQHMKALVNISETLVSFSGVINAKYRFTVIIRSVMIDVCRAQHILTMSL